MNFILRIQSSSDINNFNKSEKYHVQGKQKSEGTRLQN